MYDHMKRKIGLEEFLAIDIGSGDITSAALLTDEETSVRIIAKEDCVVAGIDEVVELFGRFDDIALELKVEDGERVRKGMEVIQVRGNAKSILKCERLALNILSRMSGIATVTANLVDECRKLNPAIKIACTRKTTPGFRYYEKKAVAIGGGDTHRFGLDDAILIKDNHIKIVGSIEEALSRAKMNKSFTKKIEIEVNTVDEAVTAAKMGADIIMLDNMPPADVEACVGQIKNIAHELGQYITVEVSGGITPDNILDYAKFADVISLGWITHSVPAVDFSLDVIDVS